MQAGSKGLCSQEKQTNKQKTNKQQTNKQTKTAQQQQQQKLPCGRKQAPRNQRYHSKALDD